MKTNVDYFYDDLLEGKNTRMAEVDFSGADASAKAVVISDFHAGGERGDDFDGNGQMVCSILENYYLPAGWNLILNGDIEEMLRFDLFEIRDKWPCLFRMMHKFSDVGRLYKTAGNHDDALLAEQDYPFPLYDAVRVTTDYGPIYIFHGHQLSAFYTRHERAIRLGVRYLLKPLHIRNIAAARSPHKRFAIEKNAYDFSLKHNCVTIIGHTHRTLFESQGRFEYIKYEIEKLCNDYPDANEEQKKAMANEVHNLIGELGKLGRRERHDILRQSLYGDELPVPCVFNCGCVIGKKGINCIEMSGRDISLIYWFENGHSKKFIHRGSYKVEPFDHTPYNRSVLNHDRLDVIKARINLLGPRHQE